MAINGKWWFFFDGELFDRDETRWFEFVDGTLRNRNGPCGSYAVRDGELEVREDGLPPFVARLEGPGWTGFIDGDLFVLERDGPWVDEMTDRNRAAQADV